MHFFLSFERLAKKTFKAIPPFLLYCFTMFQVLLAWVFFRATSTSQAFDIIKKMFDFTSLNIYWNKFENTYYFLVIAILFEFLYFLSIKNKTVNKLYKNNFIQIIEIAILISACLFYRGPEQAFIYFQF